MEIDKTTSFVKLAQKDFDISVIILLKTYYDKLSSRVKVNGRLSDQFKLNRGVKQGGILSPFLFNLFIDDLILECVESKLGAKFFEIILCIIAYCDDICLLSPNLEDLQKLLYICERFGREWALEFNLAKCLFIVFGTNRFNDSLIYLNNQPLTYTSSFKYLGLEFSYNLNMSSFFLNKFESVRKAFFSLNGYGFKAGGLSPFLQPEKIYGRIYALICVS